jgi:hypothetical protein
MTLFSVVPIICFFPILLLLPAHTHAEAAELVLFFDASCTKASTVLLGVSLDLSTCMVPIGIYGLVIDRYLACPNGSTANLIM